MWRRKLCLIEFSLQEISDNIVEQNKVKSSQFAFSCVLQNFLINPTYKRDCANLARTILL